MRLLRAFIVFCLGTTILCGDLERALAWEFSMEGGLSWEYESYSQLGSAGFFGPYDVDRGGAAPDAAVTNAWLGVQVGELASGSDNAVATLYMTFDPEIKVNKAVRIRGRYYIGSWDTPGADTSEGALVASEYFNSTALGVQRSFSPGYWNTLWITAQTPMGIIVLGKRPQVFGIGTFFDGEDNRSAEPLALVAPFGPFRLGVGIFPWRGGGGRYYDITDKNNVRRPHMGAFMTYRSGPLDMGIVTDYVRFRTGPEAVERAFTTVGAQGRDTVIPQNVVISAGGVYVKYFNGRFFFNAEVDWLNLTRENQRSLTGLVFREGVGAVAPPGDGRGSPFARSYIEHWRFGAELGATAGPAKVSLLWAWIPGPDRRHGTLIDRQPFLQNRDNTNTSFFRPYSLLLAYNYGSGNNSVSPDTGNGYMTDCTVYASRIDYAIAANLNVYGSFLWAERLSKGYGWGFIQPGLDGGGIPTGSVDFSRKGSFAAPAPAIPDNHLGWEIDWGFNWRILEGYSINASFGYWRPGRWFNFACVDRSNPGWKTPSPANNFGVNPDRTIDPVFGMEIIVAGEF